MSDNDNIREALPNAQRAFDEIKSIALEATKAGMAALENLSDEEALDVVQLLAQFSELSRDDAPAEILIMQEVSDIDTRRRMEAA
jgi:hypothetical protein